MAQKLAKLKISPPQAILLGFATMIMLGTLLLMLPAASSNGQSTSFINALFTATSANCVTGLTVLNTMSHWSLFGKIIILVLIQFGALGFMTIITLVMMLINKNISLKNRLVIQASFNQTSIGGMVRLVKNVAIITFIFELIGAIILTISFHFGSDMPFGEALWQGVFHAISAFCNAGFDNLGDSLVSMRLNFGVMATITVLVISGGLGFPVWTELIKLIRNKHKLPLRNRIVHMSLQCKIVLSMTIALLLIGWLLFSLLEWNNTATIASLPANEKLGAAFFHSATLRTAGFQIGEPSELTAISKFFSAIFMLIGGSSAGTAGGMKTVTFAIILFSMISVLRGHTNIEAFGRSLPVELLQKALTVACTMFIVVITSTTILHFTEQATAYPHTFFDLFMESCAAASSTGMSNGLTPYLSPAGKVVISLCMFLGRLSPVTVVVALSMRLHGSYDGTSLPEERVIIG